MGMNGKSTKALKKHLARWVDKEVYKSMGDAFQHFVLFLTEKEQGENHHGKTGHNEMSAHIMKALEDRKLAGKGELNFNTNDLAKYIREWFDHMFDSGNSHKKGHAKPNNSKPVQSKKQIKKAVNKLIGK